MTDGEARERQISLFHEAIDLGALRVFVAVAEERSFTRAAERLYLAQPWLSTQVRSLETRIGLQLFQRSSHHVELTPAAVTLLPLARDVLRTVDAGTAAVTGLAPAPDPRLGVLRLGAPSYTVFLGARVEAVERYEGLHPGAEIVIDSDSTTDLLSRLHRGELDAAFLLAPVASDLLCLLPFARVPMLLQIPAGHALAGRDALTLDDLAGQRVATYPPELHPAAYEWTFGPLAAAGAELVPIPGLGLDGLTEAAASLGLLAMAFAWSQVSGTVMAPLTGAPAAQIVLAAPADQAAWSSPLRAFWALVVELVSEAG